MESLCWGLNVATHIFIEIRKVLKKNQKLCIVDIRLLGCNLRLVWL